jgi:hypothetical protein
MTVTRYLRGVGSGNGNHSNPDDHYNGCAVFIVIVLWGILAYPKVFIKVVMELVSYLPKWIRHPDRKFIKKQQIKPSRPVIARVSRNPIL